MMNPIWEKISGQRWLAETQGENELGSCFRSYQSVHHPFRHCWIDASDGYFYIDFEDWAEKKDSDGTVHSMKLDSLDALLPLLEYWFTKDQQLKQLFDDAIATC